MRLWKCLCVALTIPYERWNNEGRGVEGGITGGEEKIKGNNSDRNKRLKIYRCCLMISNKVWRNEGDLGEKIIGE